MNMPDQIWAHSFAGTIEHGGWTTRDVGPDMTLQTLYLRADLAFGSTVTALRERIAELEKELAHKVKVDDKRRNAAEDMSKLIDENASLRAALAEKGKT